MEETARIHSASAFEFDCLGAPFLNHSSAVAAGFINTSLIRHEGHIGNHQRLRSGSPDRFYMVDHLVHGNRQGCVMTGNHDAGRISHQDNVDAAAINQPRKGKVVSRQYGDALSVLFHPDDTWYGYFLAHQPPKNKKTRRSAS